MVDSARIKWIIHELSAFRNGQINVSILVKVAEYSSVIAAVVGAGIVGVIIVREVNQRRIENQGLAICPPHSRQGIVMAPEHIELPIAIDVGKIARLHKHRTVFQVEITPLTAGIYVLHVNTIVSTARKNILVAIIIVIRNGHAPLVVC